MGIFNQKDTVDIFPLSCNPALDEKSIPGINAYFGYLKKAFRNPRIRNIAITGQHGVGKSSLIKSFDSRKGLFGKRRPKFLYVSMGQYQNNDDVQSNQAVSTPTVHTRSVSRDFGRYRITLDAPDLNPAGELKNQQLDEKNAIERRILLQLCAKFKGYVFSASSFRLFPEKPNKICIFALVISFISGGLLYLKQYLAPLLSNWKPPFRCLTWLLEFLICGNDEIEVLLYLFAISGAAMLLWYVLRWIATKGKNASFDIKGGNVECSVDRSGCEDYLDQYTQELVYCLSSVGRKIDYTVVFEDMDRLDNELCIPIFMRLREINHILNARMKRRKYIRFIFVVKDEVVDLLDYNKFFDLSIPVIPTLHQNSAEVIFAENLKKINRAIEKALKKECKKTKTPLCGERNCDECSNEHCVSVKCFYENMESENAEIIRRAAKALADYRKMFAVLNEYSLAVRLYFSTNTDKLTCQIAEQILAFYIYKHTWPKDYQKLIGNCEDAAFVTGTAPEGGYEELFRYLFDTGLLDLGILYSLGFAREKIAKHWEKRLASKDVLSVVNEMMKAKSYRYPELRELVQHRCAIKEPSDDPLSETELAAAIQFMTKAFSGQQCLHSWFFKDRDSDDCIRILAKLSDSECQEFIEQCKKDKNKWNVFQECYKMGGKLVHDNEWNHQMAKVYAWGVHSDSRETRSVILDDYTEVYFDQIV